MTTYITNAEQAFMNDQIHRIDLMLGTLLDMREILTTRMTQSETHYLISHENEILETNISINLANNNILKSYKQLSKIQREQRVENPIPHVNPTTVASAERIHPNPVIYELPTVTVTTGRREKKKYNTTTVTLKKKEQDINLSDVCGICLEYHKKTDIHTCNCTHEFGKDCLSGWLKICKNNNKELSCPICRVLITDDTNYRAKNTKTHTQDEVQYLPLVIEIN
jgi:hypothetical protein